MKARCLWQGLSSQHTHTHIVAKVLLNDWCAVPSINRSFQCCISVVFCECVCEREIESTRTVWPAISKLIRWSLFGLNENLFRLAARAGGVRKDGTHPSTLWPQCEFIRGDFDPLAPDCGMSGMHWEVKRWREISLTAVVHVQTIKHTVAGLGGDCHSWSRLTQKKSH